MEKIELYKSILKLIDEYTDLNGKLDSRYFKTELSINIFPEINDEDLIDQDHEPVQEIFSN